MAHGLHHLLADSVRFLALTSPIQAALIRELGAERATEIVHRVLDAMTPEERRSAVMASMAGQAQLAADIMRLDAGTGYDRCADLLNNAAGSLRQATGAYPSRMNLGALD